MCTVIDSFAHDVVISLIMRGGQVLALAIGFVVVSVSSVDAQQSSTTATFVCNATSSAAPRESWVGQLQLPVFSAGTSLLTYSFTLHETTLAEAVNATFRGPAFQNAGTEPDSPVLHSIYSGEGVGSERIVSLLQKF